MNDRGNNPGLSVDPIDEAEREWRADVSERDAAIYALSTRILYVSTLVEWSFERESQEAGLNSGEALVLDALRRRGPPYEASPAQLREQFLISFAGIGKRIGRLEEKGLVERRRHATDRRSQVIRLTDAGMAQLHRSGADHDAIHTRALRKLKPDEARTLARLLKKVQQEIEVARAAGPPITARHDAAVAKK